jgi:RNA polymerase sigma-70 factor (ECF subfamily)
MVHRGEVEELYVQSRNDVYRYLISLGLTAAQAQDATQEAFLRLHQATQRGESPDNPRAWVFRVAHNVALSERTRRSSSSLSLSPALESKAKDPSPSAEKLVMDKQKMSMLRRAISALSDQQKRCLYLRAEGLRYAEIAETLGIGISTVAEFLTRATARLRKELQ